MFILGKEQDDERNMVATYGPDFDSFREHLLSTHHGPGAGK